MKFTWGYEQLYTPTAPWNTNPTGISVTPYKIGSIFNMFPYKSGIAGPLQVNSAGYFCTNDLVPTGLKTWGNLFNKYKEIKTKARFFIDNMTNTSWILSNFVDPSTNVISRTFTAGTAPATGSPIDIREYPQIKNKFIPPNYGYKPTLFQVTHYPQKIYGTKEMWNSAQAFGTFATTLANCSDPTTWCTGYFLLRAPGNSNSSFTGSIGVYITKYLLLVSSDPLNYLE